MHAVNESLGPALHLQVRTDLVDSHIYIFSHWVLGVLDLKPHFGSAK